MKGFRVCSSSQVFITSLGRAVPDDGGCSDGAFCDYPCERWLWAAVHSSMFITNAVQSLPANATMYHQLKQVEYAALVSQLGGENARWRASLRQRGLSSGLFFVVTNSARYIHKRLQVS